MEIPGFEDLDEYYSFHAQHTETLPFKGSKIKFKTAVSIEDRLGRFFY